MERRNFLKALPVLGALPFLKQTDREELIKQESLVILKDGKKYTPLLKEIDENSPSAKVTIRG